MDWGKAREILTGFCSRDANAATLSRREMLAGLGLAGLLVATPKLLPLSAAEAGTLPPAVAPAAGAADAAKPAEEGAEGHADGASTDLSARRYRRRRYWRRRYWRPRYWRRRHWRRRYWRRRRYW